MGLTNSPRKKRYLPDGDLIVVQAGGLGEPIMEPVAVDRGGGKWRERGNIIVHVDP